MNPADPILIVDDESSILLTLSGGLKARGFNNVLTCEDPRDVMPILQSKSVELILLDLNMPHIHGIDLLRMIKEEFPDIPVIIITGEAEVSTAVECMKLGVFDYLVKAIEVEKLAATVRRALEINDLRRQNDLLKHYLVEQELDHPEAFSKIISRDKHIFSLFMYLESIALSNQTVLITGETGSGKELFAEALHRLSGRSGELTAVNIAGLDDSMFTDTLFGHKKGAYTGADQSRPGLVEKAGGGTVFLDEIGDLPTPSQTKLLRFLESREYHPLGSDVARRTNARFIVATNRDLQKAMEEGSFRKDLYFRLRTHTVHIPPLREHPGDIPLLAYHFAREAASEMGKREPEIPKEGIELLKTYTYPGNVRELRAIVYDLVSRMKNEDPGLSVEIISQHIGKTQRNYQVLNSPDLFAGQEDLPSIEEAVNALVKEALKRSGGNQARASRILGISPQALNKRLKKQ